MWLFMYCYDRTVAATATTTTASQDQITLYIHVYMNACCGGLTVSQLYIKDLYKRTQIHRYMYIYVYKG